MNEFWGKYKEAHYFYSTRLIHAVGTAIAIYCVVTAIVTGTIWLGIGGIFLAYGLAWLSHWFIEGNSPLTLKNPLYSLLCDLWMMVRIFTGSNPK